MGHLHAKRLASIGITTEHDLRTLGAVQTYLRLKKNQPRTPVAMLYVLHAALLDIHWLMMDEQERAALRHRAYLTKPPSFIPSHDEVLFSAVDVHPEWEPR